MRFCCYIAWDQRGENLCMVLRIRGRGGRSQPFRTEKPALEPREGTNEKEAGGLR